MEGDPRLIAFARRMRHEPAPAEVAMWKVLRNRRLAGFRFRRQHPVPPYIADFYCSVARLVVEVDGDSHMTNAEYDRARHAVLSCHGLRVIRFWNFEVAEDEDAVLEGVYQACLAGARENPKVAHKLDEMGMFRYRPPKPTPDTET